MFKHADAVSKMFSGLKKLLFICTKMHMIQKFNLGISVKVGPVCAKKNKTKKTELCKYETLIHMDDF